MKKIGSLLPWLVLLSLLYTYMHRENVPFVNQLRTYTFDNYQKLFPREDKTVWAYVIDIDEKSLSEVGQWPWPRNVIAKLIEKSFEAGITSMGLDIVFPEKDGKSPEEVSKGWYKDDALQSAIDKLPSNDDVLARVLAKYPVVKGFVGAPGEINNRSIAGFKSKTPIQNKSEVQQFIIEGVIGARNIPIIENASPYHGYFGYYTETESSMVRDVPLFFQHEGEIYPALSIETLRVGLADKPAYKFDYDEQGLKSVTVGHYEAIPVARNARYHVNYRKYNKDNGRYISAVDILKGRKLPEDFDGGVALVGTSAAGVFDLRSTPLDAVVPGVESHIQIIESMQTGEHVSRLPHSEELELFALLVLGIILIVSAGYCDVLGAGLIFLLINAAVVSYCLYAFKIQNNMFDGSFIVIALFILFLVQYIAKYAQEKASRLAIRSAFSHYLSPELVNIVSKDPSKLVLGGEEKEITVLFSDIRGFTSMSEGLTPKQLTRIMNRYLTPMTEIVQSNKGTIDKYMGDAIMAFWNAPLNVEDHAVHACRAALEMLSGLEVLNDSLKLEGLPEISIGVGINTDIVTVGNMGSDQRFDYTVMGDGVNLGARLEGQCKTYGVPLIISEATLNQLGEVSAMPLDTVAVKGKKEGVKLFHLISLSKPEGEIAQNIDLVERAINAYQAQEWLIATEFFKSDSVPATLSEMYIDRINSMQHKKHSNDVWDGVYRATVK